VTRSIERDRERLTIKAGTIHDTRQLMLAYYVIARYEANGLELLHIPLESGEETLPMFTSKVAARDFLVSKTLGQEWYVRESYAGELVSLLLGLCAGIEWVLIDPLPGEQAAEGNPADTAHSESFVDYLLGSKYRLFPKRPQDLVLAAAPPETNNRSLRCEGLGLSS
jgi:hypothetical protein